MVVEAEVVEVEAERDAEGDEEEIDWGEVYDEIEIEVCFLALANS